MSDNPRSDPDFNLVLYRTALMALCQKNGGTLKVDGMMELTAESGTLLNRAVPGGGWEFKYVPDSEHGHG